jgi:hypothetical protein
MARPKPLEAPVIIHTRSSLRKSPPLLRLSRRSLV